MVSIFASALKLIYDSFVRGNANKEGWIRQILDADRGNGEDD